MLQNNVLYTSYKDYSRYINIIDANETNKSHFVATFKLLECHSRFCVNIAYFNKLIVSDCLSMHSSSVPVTINITSR